MKTAKRLLFVAAATMLPAVTLLAEETAGGAHAQMTHIQGIPVIAIVAGVLGSMTVVALGIGVVAGYLTSRDDWPVKE